MTIAGRKPWTSWILRRKEVTVTTWRFRLLVLVVTATLLYLTHTLWLTAIGNSLIHEEQLERADVLLLENFDENYLVFEMAAELVRSGYATRVLVPVAVFERTGEIGEVEEAFVGEMSRIARLGNYEILPVRHTEPISLNTARQIATFLENERIRSVIVVSPRFRSARSYLVYNSVFTPLGIQVQCQASSSGRSAKNWWSSLHGFQEIGLEWLKLLYYRFWIL